MNLNPKSEMTDLQKKYLEVARENQEKVHKKLKEARDLLGEVEEMADAYGVPFRGPAYDAWYYPKGWVELFNQDDDYDFGIYIEDSEWGRPEDTTRAGQYEYWSLSSLGC